MRKVYGQNLNWKQLLAALGETLTVPLTFDDESKSCVLLFEDDLMINIEYDDDGTERIVLSSYLDELPAKCQTFCVSCLKRTCFGMGHGATFSVEETGGVIMLYAHSVSDLDAAGFETVVENFTNEAERWAKRAAQSQRWGYQEPSSTIPPAEPGSGMIFG